MPCGRQSLQQSTESSLDASSVLLRFAGLFPVVDRASLMSPLCGKHLQMRCSYNEM